MATDAVSVMEGRAAACRELLPRDDVPSAAGRRERLLMWIGGRQMLVVLLVLSAALGTFYTFAIPPWQHPDEPGHFEHARLIAEEHRLPGMLYVSYSTRREIAISMLEHDFWVIEGKGRVPPPLDDKTLSEGSPIGIPALSQPRLYYLLGAIWLQLWLPFSTEAQMYALRLLAVLMNVGIVALVWRGAKMLFPTASYLPLAACAMVVFEPMFTDMMASVNSDTLANLLGAVYFVAVARLFREGLRPRLAFIAIGAVIAGVFTKTTFIGVAATLPILVLTYPWRRRWLRVAMWVVAAIGLALVAGFVWVSLEGASGPVGEVAGQLVGRAQRYFRVYWADSLRSVLGIDRQGPSLADTVGVVFRSFWAYFGWRSVAMPEPYYLFPLALTIAGVVGLVASLVRWLLAGGQDGWRAGYLAFAFLSVLTIWAMAILRSQIVQGLTTYSHGRYAFVGMVPFALLMVRGIMSLFPARWRPWVVVGLVVAMALFDGACVRVALGA